MLLSLIIPEWPTPAGIIAYTTTRLGGISQGKYQGLNLSMAVGDEPQAVMKNRNLLKQVTELPSELINLNQVHGSRCLILDGQAMDDLDADAAYTRTPGCVCSVLTADCLPLLVCSIKGDEVAAIHAGWRGLVTGIVEATLANFTHAPSQLLVWLGPAIGPQAFVVDDAVKQAFTAKHPAAVAAFHPVAEGTYGADIYALARQRLQAVGVPVQQIYGGNYCTLSDPRRFFSYRRDKVTGRMASVISLPRAG